MADYKHRGSDDALSKYTSAYDKVQRLSAEGNQTREDIKSLEEKIQVADNDYNLSDKEVLELKQKLKSAEAKRISIEEKRENLRKDRQDKSASLSGLKEKFSGAKSDRDSAKKTYLDSVSGNENTKITISKEVVGPSKESLDVYALGDIHGWAPGLTTYLAANELAEIKISGLDVNKNPTKVYPDYNLLSQKGKLIEGQWIDGSTFTPLQEKDRKEIYRGAFSNIEVLPGKTLDKSLFLQVGDLNDRGDYSELNFDIMRKFSLSSGGRAFALIGNHEEMLLRGNYKNWKHNEEESGFFNSLESPGSFRLRHEFLNIKEDVESYHRSVFFSYCAHFAHMLLTQEFVIREMLDEDSRKRYVELTQPALDLGNINDSKLQEIALSNDWKTVEFCFSWLEKIWRSEKPVNVPGAIVLFSVGHVLGLHASINSLNKFFDHKRSSDFKKSFKTKSGAELNLHLYSHVHGSPSPDTDMLWQRDGKTWTAKAPSKKMAESVQKINKHLPHVTNIVQGHEVLSSKDLDIKSHSVIVPSGEVKISNLDVGMTPVYLPTKLENKYDVKRVPNGISIETFGRVPRIQGIEFKTTAALKVVPRIEKRNQPYAVSLYSTKPSKEIARISRDAKGYRMKIIVNDVRIGVNKNGKSLLVEECTFPLQNVTINLYKIVRGWLGSYPEPLGRIALGNLSKVDEKKDPILIQAQKEKDAAEKKAKEAAEKKAKEAAEKKAKEAAEKKAKEDAAKKEKAKKVAEKKAKEDAAKKEKANSEDVEEIQKILDSPDSIDAAKVSVAPSKPEGGIASTARISVTVTPVPQEPPVTKPKKPKTQSSSNITRASDKIVVYVDKMLVEKHSRMLIDKLARKLENVSFIFCDYDLAFLPKNVERIPIDDYNKRISMIKPSTNVFRITTKDTFPELSSEEKKYTISYVDFTGMWKTPHKVLEKFTGVKLDE